MPKGYIIGQITVTDPEGYPEYVRRDTPILESHGAKFVIRGGRSEVKEGTAGDRHVVIEFPSYEAAMAAYE
jgi:uncharacterized protein (DUF1330 family)